jgi:uncharacterized membrane protein (UPF0127 family)
MDTETRNTSGMDRRQFVSLVGTTLLAGCQTASDGGGNTTTPPEAGTDTGTAVTTAAPPTDPTATEPRTATPTPTPTPVHASYETTTVVARTPAGEQLGAVTAAIADSSRLRYRGLSDTPSLPPDRGMLFVFASAGDRTFVMRGMAFGIDIVYADSGGVITDIHHAPAPGPDEDGSDQRYPGYGQYVLELNRGWTTDHDVAVGDVLAFEL